MIAIGSLCNHLFLEAVLCLCWKQDIPGQPSSCPEPRCVGLEPALRFEGVPAHTRAIASCACGVGMCPSSAREVGLPPCKPCLLLMQMMGSVSLHAVGDAQDSPTGKP